ncbi:hypothetical protein B0H17DRAFT_1217604 [Mycena rosella]|uniref:Uncharacterized protein n=1 Tax=Mycena rosella TaxID=1033263 RepID=A0AAD7BVR8_MYCRO|nr:hypothetical protein B0H17DRAFT_1217604 [Mycena rosella]
MNFAAGDEGAVVGSPLLLTANEKRKQRRREASKRYYAKNPGIKEQKHLRKAERNKMSMGSPEELKRGPQGSGEDFIEGTLATDKEDLMASGDEGETANKTDSEDFDVQYQYEMSMEEVANSTTENIADYRGSESDEPSDSAVNSCHASDVDVRPADERLVAETLAGMSELVRLWESSTSMRTASHQDSSLKDGQDSGRDLAISGAEMSNCRSLTAVEGHSAHGAPAIELGTDDTVTSAVAASRTKIFRGYRYEAQGPRPESVARQVVLRAGATGICGMCPNADKCENGGDNGERLCDRCVDCQTWGYACWDHFNGVQEWEESLW